MEQILESIINGQHKQALQQLVNSQYTLDDLFEFLLEENRPEKILTMYRVAVSTECITFKD
jgi:hypothetical protein